MSRLSRVTVSCLLALMTVAACSSDDGSAEDFCVALARYQQATSQERVVFSEALDALDDVMGSAPDDAPEQVIGFAEEMAATFRTASSFGATSDDLTTSENASMSDEVAAITARGDFLIWLGYVDESCPGVFASPGGAVAAGGEPGQDAAPATEETQGVPLDIGQTAAIQLEHLSTGCDAPFDAEVVAASLVDEQDLVSGAPQVAAEGDRYLVVGLELTNTADQGDRGPLCETFDGNLTKTVFTADVAGTRYANEVPVYELPSSIPPGTTAFADLVFTIPRDAGRVQLLDHFGTPIAEWNLTG